MNRRQLFKTLIYAPLLAPLAGMMPKEMPAWMVPSSASSGTVTNGVNSVRSNTMSQETICFVIRADSKEGQVAVRKMTDALKDVERLRKRKERTDRFEWKQMTEPMQKDRTAFCDRLAHANWSFEDALFEGRSEIIKL